MFLDCRNFVEVNDILECTKEFERRILKEERMSERSKNAQPFAAETSFLLKRRSFGYFPSLQKESDTRPGKK
jgi:hypothetical protein